jgi:hypothetical protein
MKCSPDRTVMNLKPKDIESLLFNKTKTIENKIFSSTATTALKLCPILEDAFKLQQIIL